MKTPQTFLLAIAAIAFATTAQAKIWRVNNNAGTVADFTSSNAVNTAMNNSVINNGDTIHFEPSASDYGNLILTKKTVVIGNGYFLGGANGNSGLQQNQNGSYCGYIEFFTGSNGSKVMGMTCGSMYFEQSATPTNDTAQRCYIAGQLYLNNTGGTTMQNNLASQCYVGGIFAQGASSINCNNFVFQNNIITSGIDLFDLNTASNCIFRNNTFATGQTLRLRDFYVANNISTSNNTFNLLNCVVKNNIAANGGQFGTANGNQANVNPASLFITSASNDAQFQLKTGSPAIGAGFPNGATPVDCGAYGGPVPYRLSGIPAIPSIYTLTVPASVTQGSTTMSVTIGTRSNN